MALTHRVTKLLRNDGPGDAKPLPVLIDGRLASRGLGIGRFVTRLCAGHRNNGHEVTLFPISPASSAGSRHALLRSLGVRSMAFSIAPRIAASTPGIVHFACNSGSVWMPRRSVVTVHDLFQRESRSLIGKAQWRLLDRALRSSATLVAVSSRTADAVRDAGYPVSRLHCIPSGMDEPVGGSEQRAGIVAFGGSSLRKRPDLLCSVVEQLRSEGWAEPVTILARAGLSDTHRVRLQRQGALIREDADDQEVANLLASSSALLLTSSNEGFGLPIVEAAEHQLPVVIGSDAVVATEAIGPHCVFADGDDAVAWTSAIRKAAGVRDPLDGRYLASWDDVAAQYWDLYERLL